MSLRGAGFIGGIESIGPSLRVEPSKKLNDCLLHGRMVADCPWISRFGSFSEMTRDEISEPTVTTANLESREQCDEETIEQN